MTIQIRYATVTKMLELLKKLKQGHNIHSDLVDLLDHEDYRVEFARYQNRVSKQEFVDYILQIETIDEEDITNQDIAIHHKYYKDLMGNIDDYINESNKLSELTEALFEEQIHITLQGLPDDFQLPDLHFIFTLGIGQSFGWVHGNNMHFDFLQLTKDIAFDEFCQTISHEVHHVCINKLYSTIDMQSLSLESLFYLYFSGEGLAVKYCNNAEGVISKAIYNRTKNIGLDSWSWNYLNSVFDKNVQEFKQTIADIRNGVISTKDQLDKRFNDYWMSGYTKDQNRNELPKLRQYPVYSMGNDIWGIIHDCLGKEVVYDTLKNTDQFVNVFNSALDKIDRSDLKI